MQRHALFVIFDCATDQDLCDRLIQEAQAERSSFIVKGHSVDEHRVGMWKEVFAQRLTSIDQVAVICGEGSDRSEGVNQELKVVMELQKPYFLLRGRDDKPWRKPRQALPQDPVYEWAPDSLRRLVRGVRWE